MALKIVEDAKKAVEGTVKASEEVQNFKWSEKTEEERAEELEKAEANYDGNIAATDLKIDEAVRMGFIDEDMALDILKQQEDYLNWLYFNKPVNKIAKLEEKMYGEEVEKIEVGEEVKGLLRLVREKTYYCGLLCMKMDNIKAVDAEVPEAAKARRAKIREKRPETADYLDAQPETSDMEDAPKGKGKKGRKKRGK